MYTQCPECSVSFRVTAEVLKMAAGKVRCGGCGVAFNALEHLSETKPYSPPPPEEISDPELPELQPEERAELEADTPAESISAEQSAALLKTLDQLAGEDIRIEDTGVEWRVIEDGEDVSGGDTDAGDTDAEEGADEPSRVIDEMLFDDNTVLPDDFDEVVEVPSRPRFDEQPLPPLEPEKAQFDLDLSEPDEWDDLLDDFAEPATETRADDPEEEEEEALEETDVRESFDELLDVDTQFEIQAEAMGIDLSGIHAATVEEASPAPQLESDDQPEPEPEPEPEIADEDTKETSIDEDLIGAAFEAEAAASALEEPTEETPALEDEAPEDGPLEEAEDDERKAQFEEAGAEAADDEGDIELEVNLEAEDGVEIEDDVEDIAMAFDDEVEKDIATLSMSLDDDADDHVATRDEDHVVPEMSEEEKTINMMIDQELFNVAVEDDDGFASTMVQLDPVDEATEETGEHEVPDGPKKKKDKTVDFSKVPTPDMTVETIVMEGEFVRGELDLERPADESAARLDEPESPGIAIPLNREKDDYARRGEMDHKPAGAGTWVAIVALVLLLGVQVVHQSREALATVPAFNSAIGPIYRMLGRPLTPRWNIGGWRFEATKGDTDETGGLLTIYSRVGNNSDEALPYPLVHLSLTDRFEEIIGSAVMEPAEYLPENADPRKPVPPGSSFNAVISIDSPSPDATGFKLNVCYRLAGGQLRCADHDFK